MSSATESSILGLRSTYRYGQSMCQSLSRSMETIFDEDCTSDRESTVSSASFTSRARLQERSASSTSFRTLKGRTSSFSGSWQPMPESISASDNLPTLNDTVPSDFALDFPELAGLITDPLDNLKSHLSTPPYSHPEPISHTTPARGTYPIVSASESFVAPPDSVSIRSPHYHDQISTHACSMEQSVTWTGFLYITATHICFRGQHLQEMVRITVDMRVLDSINRKQYKDQFTIHLRVLEHTPTGSAIKGAHAHADYVFTGFTNTDQTFAAIERSWIVHRQVMSHLSGSLATRPQTTVITKDNEATHVVRAPSLSSSDHDVERRRYSLNEGNLFDRKARSISNWTYDAQGDKSTPRTSSSTTTQRPNVSSIDNQYDTHGSVGSFLGFLHRRRTGTSRSVSPSGHRKGSSSEDSMDSHAVSPALTSLDKGSSTYNIQLAAPIPIQSKLSSAPLKHQKLKSPTPPPSLLSPSLTTTKVSRSSSTCQDITDLSFVQGHVAHNQKDDQSNAFSIGTRINISPSLSLTPSLKTETTGSESTKTPPTEDPSPPGELQIHGMATSTVCKCVEHYRYAVLSTVVPMPLDVCFEWLYSAQGLGLGDTLVRTAHQNMNSSFHIDISPWAKEPTGAYTSNTSEWEGKRRQLHYSVTFKIPMLAKTSTLCNEVQEILEYNDQSIRLHSESTTPNVLYGDHFSTVNQVCLTLDSPGMTRIKCSAEVKFKKSTIWSSRIETSAMEGCGLYYKDLVRQLMESTRSQEPCLVRSSAKRSMCGESGHTIPHFQHLSTSTAPTTSSATTTLEAASTMARSSSQGFIGISPAHSLLAQQYLRNHPTLTKIAKPSGDSSDLSMEPNQALITSTNNSVRTNSTAVTPPDSQPSTTVQQETSGIWNTFIRTSLVFVTRPFASNVTLSQGQDIRPCDPVSDTQVYVDASTNRPGSQDNLSSPAEPRPCAAPSTLERHRATQELTLKIPRLDSVSVLDSDPRQMKTARPMVTTPMSNKSLWFVLAIAMMVSVLNIWYLFRTISSMADMIHSSSRGYHLTVKSYTPYNRDRVAYDTSLGVTHPSPKHFDSLPPLVQAAMLRTEMDDLAHLLDAMRTSNNRIN